MKSELVVENKPKAVISEDIRTVRTNLEFSSVDGKVKTVMVTSSVPGEGKSFISANLAAAFAQINSKVLLIDCDLRLGRTHKVFELSNKKGLSNLIIKLNEDVSVSDYVQETHIKNLYVLSRGIVPHNPTELLSSKKFRNVLEELKNEFDVIILDCPPVNGLSDALLVSKYADKVVIVSKYGSTNIDDLEDTKKALTNAGADIAGVILNSVPKNRQKYGYYYNYE